MHIGLLDHYMTVQNINCGNPWTPRQTRKTEKQKHDILVKC